MNYCKHKDFTVSEIGVGCYSLSGVYGKKDINEFRNMINRAYELGVNFFDTAEAYGNAEEILGEIVKPYRKNVYIATKVGIKEGMVPNLSEDYIKHACVDSLNHLKTDYIDLYQIHFDDPNTPVENTINALENLKKEGKIRQYGVGHLPADRVKRYFKIGSPFSLLMELSAVAREARERLLPLCKEYNVGAIAFSTTGRGILTGRFQKGKQFEAQDLRNIDPLFQYERYESALRVTEEFVRIGEKYGKTSAQVAINWVLSQTNVICALTGPSTIPHLEENIGASGWSISKDDLVELEIFFSKEDVSLRDTQKKTLERILQSALPEEPFKAFTDLVYAIETAILLDLTTEKDIMPVYQTLLGIYRNLNETTKESLESVQLELKKIINFG